MHKDIAHKVCELIAGVLAVDGEIHPAESKLFGRLVVALRENIDPVEEIEPTLKGKDAAEELRTMPEDVRAEAFALLLAAAIVDGKVVPKEENYLKAVASALGVSEILFYCHAFAKDLRQTFGSKLLFVGHQVPWIWLIRLPEHRDML